MDELFSLQHHDFDDGYLSSVPLPGRSLLELHAADKTEPAILNHDKECRFLQVLLPKQHIRVGAAGSLTITQFWTLITVIYLAVKPRSDKLDVKKKYRELKVN